MNEETNGAKAPRHYWKEKHEREMRETPYLEIFAPAKFATLKNLN